MSADKPSDTEAMLPSIFARWFSSRGWTPRAHQLELLALAQQRRSSLLIAPTGGGKTLAGFLPSLVELSQQPASSRRPYQLHSLYISPLKALAVDVARNLEEPVTEMALDLRIESRTGDTPPPRRQRQRYLTPDILLTTPEQLALMVATKDADRLFGHLRVVILDEVHALHNTKRGDLLALGLTRLQTLAPGHIRIGLSATVADPEPLRSYLMPQCCEEKALSCLVKGQSGVSPEIRILTSQQHIPWAGHMAKHAVCEVMEEIKSATTALIFVNTRAQAEHLFQDLWSINESNLPIALHHGSLSTDQRRKVESAMANGRLKAVVCTSTLDLGIDWGAVDRVICIGAPKGAARLLQRIGRANHRLDEPSRALLVPANRFEVLECEAARDAVLVGELDTEHQRPGGLDVLAQHIMGRAVAGPFQADELYREVVSAYPYRELSREDFLKTLEFVANGGYALKRYERYARLRPKANGEWRLSHPRLAQNYRLNVGVIVEEPMLDIRVLAKGRPIGAGGRLIGRVEEYFIETLTPGDTFVFAGEVLCFEGIRENAAFVSRTRDPEAQVPSYMGGKFPLSTFLAERVRQMIADPARRARLPHPVREWLDVQQIRSAVPQSGQLLVETFVRRRKHYLVCYPFEGRLAHQTLGMLLTRRLERAGRRPIGFVANEYALAIWGAVSMVGVDLDALFASDMLGDDLDDWLSESALYKRTFRNCAIVSGLIQTRSTGRVNTNRQVTFSSDLIYDVLREHEPDHILLRATYQDAASGLLDLARLSDLLVRISGHIIVRNLDRVSPLAVPVLLEISKEMVPGQAQEDILREIEEGLVHDAMSYVENAHTSQQ